jgi:hypothetical protein
VHDQAVDPPVGKPTAPGKRGNLPPGPTPPPGPLSRFVRRDDCDDDERMAERMERELLEADLHRCSHDD